MMAIASFDTKLLDIFQGIDAAEMGAKPLQYISIKNTAYFMPKSRNFTNRWR